MKKADASETRSPFRLETKGGCGAVFTSPFGEGDASDM